MAGAEPSRTRVVSSVVKSSCQLRVAAATTVGDKGFDRTEALLGVECDVIVIDNAYGHNHGRLHLLVFQFKLGNSGWIGIYFFHLQFE